VNGWRSEREEARPCEEVEMIEEQIAAGIYFTVAMESL
jgi:hypothetical protein